MTGKDGPISQVELHLWIQFRQKFGLSTDRIIWAVANGSAAMIQRWGGSISNEDLIPKFGRSSGSSLVKLAHQLAGLPGATVEFVPKHGGSKLEGDEALAVLDNYRSDGKRKTTRTLDDRTPPKKKPGQASQRRRTLGGD